MQARRYSQRMVPQRENYSPTAIFPHDRLLNTQPFTDMKEPVMGVAALIFSGLASGRQPPDFCQPPALPWRAIWSAGPRSVWSPADDHHRRTRSFLPARRPPARPRSPLWPARQCGQPPPPQPPPTQTQTQTPNPA